MALPDWNARDYISATDLVPINHSALAPNSIPAASRLARQLVVSLFAHADMRDPTQYPVNINSMVATIRQTFRYWASLNPTGNESQISIRRLNATAANYSTGLILSLNDVRDNVMSIGPITLHMFRKYDAIISKMFESHGVNPDIGKPLFWGYAAVQIVKSSLQIQYNADVALEIPSSELGGTNMKPPYPAGVGVTLQMLSQAIGYNVPFPHAYYVGAGQPLWEDATASRKRTRSRSTRPRNARGQYTRRF